MASKLVLIATAALMIAALPSIRDMAEAESRGGAFGSPGRAAALVAEASRPSPGGRDTAVLAEAESNGPTRAGVRDTAFASLWDAMPGRGVG